MAIRLIDLRKTLRTGDRIPVTLHFANGHGIVYFQDGVLGWLMHKRPEWFGIKVEQKNARVEAAE